MTTETDVLIVGAGPVGLSLALELGMRGIRAIVVERNERGGVAPRAKTTNVRTRTHLRRWGIADQLAGEAPFGIDYPNNMVFATRMTGHELARFENAFNAFPKRDARYPEHAQWVPQYTVEKVMVNRARELSGIDIRFGVEFHSARQDDKRVTSAIVDADGQEETVTSSYLVGADGSRSTVRALIGAEMVGRHGLSHHYNIIFRAPGWTEAHKLGPAAIYWLVGKDGACALGPMDKGDIWYFAPGGAKPGHSLPKEEAAELIRHRTGIDLPVEVLSADSWTASVLLADRYADGRIFLAGDACHLHPPAGGYGMNMGVGDGVDLGWKIAATLQGWGGPKLLENYETERRMMHQALIDEAMANYASYVEPPFAKIEDETPEGEAIRVEVGANIQANKGREFHTLGAILGLSYRSPLIAEEGGPEPEFDPMVYTPCARPGHLAPHAWLPDGRSLYDAFGQDFTLLVSESADLAEVTKAEKDAAHRNIPMKTLRADDIDIDRLYGASLALIRPDQYVAWRGDRWEHVLARASGMSEATAEL